MERWFVNNLIRYSKLPFIVDYVCETLDDIINHYLDGKKYSLSLRQLKYVTDNDSDSRIYYQKIIAYFIAHLLVGPVKYNYTEIAFYVYACRTIGIPPIHITYIVEGHVCIEKYGPPELNRLNAYKINDTVYNLPSGELAFEFIKKDLIYRIPEETAIFCEYDNQTFKVYRTNKDDHYNVKMFIRWAGEKTCKLLKKCNKNDIERFNILIEPYQSYFESASVHAAVYDACINQKFVGKFVLLKRNKIFFDHFQFLSEILN